MREGVFDYMVKPTPLADLTVRVAKALERRRMTVELRGYQADLQKRVTEQACRIRRILIKSLETLSNALEAKDENTRNHSARVAVLAEALAERMCPEDCEFHRRIRLAGLLHDIGKIGVPEAILNKPGRLEPAEFAQIQKHPVIGEMILRPLLEGDEDILGMVRHHHERWDGRGYPDGLAGEETPLSARIAAVADAFDAMRCARPYRQGMPLETVLGVLRDGAGTQWDAEVVATLQKLEADGLLEAYAPDGQRPHTDAALPAGEASNVWADGSDQSRPAWSHGPVVFARGFLDAKAGERLEFKVEAVLSRGIPDFVLDMGESQPLESFGPKLIYRLHVRALEVGSRMVIRDAPAAVIKQLHEAGLAQTLIFEHSSTRRRH
jgi:putative nucleotidyltransferase with HDIG domain